MLGVSIRSSCKKLHILPLPIVYTAETLIYVKTITKCYTTNSLVHTYNTRGKKNVYNIPHSTSLYSESFIHTCLQLYNTLPGYLKEMPSSKFKSQLQALLHKTSSIVLTSLKITFKINTRLNQNKKCLHV